MWVSAAASSFDTKTELIYALFYIGFALVYTDKLNQHRTRTTLIYLYVHTYVICVAPIPTDFTLAHVTNISINVIRPAHKR